LRIVFDNLLHVFFFHITDCCFTFYNKLLEAIKWDDCTVWLYVQHGRVSGERTRHTADEIRYSLAKHIGNRCTIHSNFEIPHGPLFSSHFATSITRIPIVLESFSNPQKIRRVLQFALHIIGKFWISFL